MEKPIISIIVPIYNVAPYLHKCIHSLQRQTLKKIEVIMIDDGSTDGSGSIAEKYVSNSWPRFRLIHTENKGLSAARNIGIDEAKADYLMFVDSDDWVRPTFCEIPYRAHEKHESDLVIFNGSSVGRWFTQKRLIESYADDCNVDEIAAHEYGGTAAWNKLYSKELFHDIKYPEDRVYEDFSTTHKLIHKARNIVLLSEQLYFHRYRRDSISHTYTKKNEDDLFISIMGRCNDLIAYGFPEEKVYEMKLTVSIRRLLRYPYDDDIFTQQAKIFLGSVTRIPKKISIKYRITIITYLTNETLFHILCRIIQNRTITFS